MTGPVSCSEIHIDLRAMPSAKIDGKSLINQDHPQVIEIWNNVPIIQPQETKHKEPVIDTGMVDRQMAMQGKQSNYDTDIFLPIINAISKLSGIAYGANEQSDIAMRVIADHLRTIAFSITDGQLPSNAKAGYVIRRILRRAVRYAYTFLNQHQAFMYQLIDVLIEVMGGAYPELMAQKTLIEKVIKEEKIILKNFGNRHQTIG